VAVADLAVMMAGAVTVPVYASLIGEQAAYILGDSGTKALFAEDASYVKRVADHDAGAIERLVRTWHFADLPMDDPPPALARQVDERIAAVRADDLATIVYTSGTTGPPKGVMLTHANLACETRGSTACSPDGGRRAALFLPLAHIFGRVLVAMQFRVGYTTAIAEFAPQGARQRDGGQPHLHGLRAASLREGVRRGQREGRRRRGSEGAHLPLGDGPGETRRGGLTGWLATVSCCRRSARASGRA